MKSLLTLAAIASLAVAPASADMLWYIAVGSMDVVDCWNVDTCSPVSATTYGTNLSNGNQHVVATDIFGPNGNPLVWAFQLSADGVLAPGTQLDSLRVHFEGPGFDYTYARDFDPLTAFYLPGPPTPPASNEVIAPADGCAEIEQIFDWTWDNFPNGQVAIIADFVVPDGETLYIEPGITGYFTGGHTLVIEGEIDAMGTEADPITFHGLNWDGINVTSTGSGSIAYAMITGVDNELAGGALTVAGSLTVERSIIANNSTTGMGGGIHVETGGVALVFSSTVAHNSAADGGDVYVATGASCGGLYNVFANGTPNTFVSVDDEVSSLQFTNFFPLGDLNPDIVPYHCDPGFADPMNNDFYLSYWSVDDPEMINCVIDVSVDPELMDPDGTPLDMGAIPFDQHLVMHGCDLVAVEDRPNDQGGFVLVEFDASPNDGSNINPITQYSIWIQYPDTPEDEWISAGTVAAIGNPDETYAVQVATQDDQYEGMENIHNFMVGTHSVWFPQAIPSDVMTGFSLDNLAPMPVAGLGDGGWYYDQWPPQFDNVDLSWAPNMDNDLAHYDVYASLVDDFDNAEHIYSGTGLSTTWTTEYGTLTEGTPVYFWTLAVDEHMNVSEPSDYTVMYESVSVELPTSFSLAQNHPNPFNPTTSIAYALPQAADVNLKVYNMAGAEVATLVQSSQAAGNYTVTFDASNLASGVYVYRIEAGSFNSVKKMVLVK